VTIVGTAACGLAPPARSGPHGLVDSEGEPARPDLVEVEVGLSAPSGTDPRAVTVRAA
jgi:hypothetical protein